MAKFAIVGFVAVASLVLATVTAQSGFDPTRIDDSDYDYDGSASGDDHDYYPDFPLIADDPEWKDSICLRYRSGAPIIVFNKSTVNCVGEW